MSFYHPPDGDRALSPPIAYPRPAIEVNAVIKLVYTWMFLGLLVTAGVAWFVSTNDALLDMRLNGGVGLSLISLVVMFGVLFALHGGLTRNWLSPNLAGALYFVFTGVMGFSLSLTLFAFMSPTVTNQFGQVVTNPYYDPGAVYAAFGTAAALFGAMTFVGFTTKTDLTKFGAYLFMGLIGLIIALFINMIIGSGTLGFVISIIGVIIFTGLTAYDTQKIKEMSESQELQSDGSLMMKFSIIGAISLYLDFINLFLFLLRIFAASRD